MKKMKILILPVAAALAAAAVSGCSSDAARRIEAGGPRSLVSVNKINMADWGGGKPFSRKVSPPPFNPYLPYTSYNSSYRRLYSAQRPSRMAARAPRTVSRK